MIYLGDGEWNKLHGFGSIEPVPPPLRSLSWMLWESPRTGLLTPIFTDDEMSVGAVAFKTLAAPSPSKR